MGGIEHLRLGSEGQTSDYGYSAREDGEFPVMVYFTKPRHLALLKAICVITRADPCRVARAWHYVRGHPRVCFPRESLDRGSAVLQR